jgi:hypothetical protein
VKIIKLGMDTKQVVARFEAERQALAMMDSSLAPLRALRTPEELAGFLGVDGIRISRERFQSSASAKSRVTPDLVLLFNGLDDVTVDDPTHAKRFWSATESGGKFRVYEHQGERQTCGPDRRALQQHGDHFHRRPAQDHTLTATLNTHRRGRKEFPPELTIHLKWSRDADFKIRAQGHIAIGD